MISMLLREASYSGRSRPTSVVSPINDRPLHHILKFAAAAAKHSMTMRWGLLDAGILALGLLAVVDGVPSLISGVLDVLTPQTHRRATSLSKHRPQMTSPDIDTMAISLAVINKGAFKLLLLCQAPQVQALFQSEIFIERRNICFYLLDVLLGCGEGWADAFQETRDLFAQILAKNDICKSTQSIAAFLR
jgi:hypothetical protein